MIQILQGDCRDVLRTLPDESVHCCVTSPPYWGLRDYGVDGQIGLEESLHDFVGQMVGVFREVRRVLRKDGTCWVNLGDSYAGARGGAQGTSGQLADRSVAKSQCRERGFALTAPEIKPKEICGVPWRVAFALQADGWFLRQDIVWHKPNPMPESVTDRCTKAHEYLFLLTKAGGYWWDADAIREPVTGGAHRRGSDPPPAGWGQGEEPRTARELQREGVHRKSKPGVPPKSAPAGNGRVRANDSFQSAVTDLVIDRNKRSVWTVPSEPYKGAHFATYPPSLIRPCILAGCPVGGTVLDPFGGSGTTGQVALELGRRAILIELNPEYVALAHQRTNVTPGLALA